MENNDKIDFDLDFLDKNIKEKPKTPPKDASKDPNWVYHKDGKGNQSSTPAKKESPYKVWLWGIFIVVVIGVLVAASDDSTTTTTPTSSPTATGIYTDG